jgi:anti-sigma regulatory factor (Ser/Thr protein kinase)
MNQNFEIKRTENKIELIGKFGMTEIHPFLATVHHATNKLGYQDLIFDFSKTTAAFPGPMICVCSKAVFLKKENVDIKLIPPDKEDLRRLFVNTNWAYFICPNEFQQSTFRGYTHVPTILFKDHNEQAEAVNKILDAILSSIRDIDRKDLSAVEWAINEITDNVLVHSESKIGGLLQLSSFKTKQKRIEYVVCDAGVGILSTLKPALNLRSDVQCLDMSIKEGVTNGKGAGNGLYGSYQTASKSGGYFHVHSGNASLSFNPGPRRGLLVKNERIPFDGTLLVSCLDYSVPQLLENALVFGGKKEDRPDFIELNFEDINEDKVNFSLFIESNGFGTRAAGLPVRNKIINLLNYYNSAFTVIIDFNNVPLLSSSFADEVFGKLFQEIGEKEYRTRMVLRNCDKMNKMLIDRSIHQRKEKMGTP